MENSKFSAKREGHDFSRAVSIANLRALAPAMRSTRMMSLPSAFEIALIQRHVSTTERAI
jgi:hypothetical protein